MKIAEQVTFGGGGALDRAAHLRGNAGALARLAGRHSEAVLPLWRGKLLMDKADDATEASLVWLPDDHGIFSDANDPPVFLGLEHGQPRFARDTSDWVPADAPDITAQFLDQSEQAHPALPPSQRFCDLRANMVRLDAAEAELAATAKAVLGWHETHRYCSRCGQESAMVEAGWQRRCPGCGSAHFPRTDPVVIMLVTMGNDLLLGRSPGWPDGMYSLLAGFVEPGETLEAAVRREVFEETQVQCGPVRYLSSQPWPFPSSLMFGCQAEAQSRDITLDPIELEDAFWISKSELADVFAGTSNRILPARRGAIAQFLMQNWLADRLD